MVRSGGPNSLVRSKQTKHSRATSGGSTTSASSERLERASDDFDPVDRSLSTITWRDELVDGNLTIILLRVSFVIRNY